MDLLTFRDYCLSLPCTEESTPFHDQTLVFKVGGKMYAYARMVDFERIALKCDPDLAIQLRETYPEITPAWHSNKRHWNDVSTNGDLPDVLIREQIRNSYRLVLAQNVSPKTLKEEILKQCEKQRLPQ
ncbi:MAG: MmcQ/YjbR family DNA-binding protein [Alistipes sp.]